MKVYRKDTIHVIGGYLMTDDATLTGSASIVSLDPAIVNELYALDETLNRINIKKQLIAEQEEKKENEPEAPVFKYRVDVSSTPTLDERDKTSKTYVKECELLSKAKEAEDILNRFEGLLDWADGTIFKSDEQDDPAPLVFTVIPEDIMKMRSSDLIALIGEVCEVNTDDFDLVITTEFVDE